MFEIWHHNHGAKIQTYVPMKEIGVLLFNKKILASTDFCIFILIFYYTVCRF
jgi:hypothetical protein